MNRRAAIVLFMVLIGMSPACRKTTVEIPEGILKPVEMTALLADIHVVQAAVSLHSATDTSFTPFAAYAPAIFSNHGITSATYDSSLVFYTRHPELLDSIYKNVIVTLSRRQSEEEGRN